MFLHVHFSCINVELTDLEITANVKDSKVQSTTCTIEPKIPFYLIVAGILNIVLLVLRIVFQVGKTQCTILLTYDDPASILLEGCY